MAPGKGRVVSLDGLRALAILLVLLDHSLTNFEGGGIGVSVFFVLSGFLITTLLVRERERTGNVSLRLFYSRRALRLYPALLVMLAVTIVLGCSAKMGLIAATYTTDIYNAVTSNSTGPYQHTWSLSLEEQFYLLWPLLLAPLALRYRRHAVPILLVAAFGSTAFAWFGTQAMVARDGTITSAVFNPLWQAHGLLIGCALALWRPRAKVRRPNEMILAGSAAILVIAVLASVTVDRDWAAGWNLLSELAAAAVIAGMVAGEPLRGLSRIYETGAAVWIGARSYGIYLWHLPLIYLVALHGLAPPNVSSLLGAAVIGVPLAFVAAAISYRWVEAPFLRIKDRMHQTAPTAPEVPAPEVPAAAVVAAGR
jgi:peptidoglycan/LPS O-acetylase OafA/YrhL